MSTIIKAGESATVLRRLSTVDLADHLAEARAVMEEARRRAAAIIARAEEQARAATESAREEGYRVGQRQGLEDGAAEGRKAAFEQARESFAREHDRLVAALRSAVEGFDAMKEELRVAATRDLMDFAIEAAIRLTFAIGDLRRESATENFQRALRILGWKTDLTVRVHPKDLAAMRTFASAVSDRVDAASSVTFVEDETLAPGGCVVRNEFTEVDASLETQVAELVSQLTGRESDG